MQRNLILPAVGMTFVNGGNLAALGTVKRQRRLIMQIATAAKA